MSRPNKNPPDWDAGKLDLLAVAEGKQPRLYTSGDLAKFHWRAPLGLWANTKDLRLDNIYGSGAVVVPPIEDLSAIRLAERLVDAGYYDARSRK